MSSTKTYAMGKNDLVSFARTAGEEAAKGGDSILSLGFRVYCSAKSAGLEVADVEDVYRAYAETANLSQFGRQVSIDSKTSFGNGVSKLRNFAKLASAKIEGGSAFQLVGDTVAVIRDAEGKAGKGKGGSTYEQVLRVIRAQLRRAEDGSTKRMTKTEIARVLAPKVSTPEVSKKLQALIDACDRELGEESQWNVLDQSHFEVIKQAAVEQLALHKARLVAEKAATILPAADEEVSDFDQLMADAA